ncbi:36.4 kDa proline-rich protein-like [Melia azedarach]|uniref:36.4 kDa proline-rich protein-like n=1 Tax=Melia azedarach TaxID=155640 RepID=A0ACC1X2C2_MELAZ|nr:36.4 kDa proline-rich protein-like [Melia azedarach]
MGKVILLIVGLLNLGTLLSSLACDCSNPPPSPPPPPSNCPPPPYSPTPKPPPLPKIKPTPPSPVPKPPSPPKQKTCPVDALKLGACVDLLGGLVHVGIGRGSAKEACCPLLQGIADLDAAICLCTTIKARLANIVNLTVPVALELLVNCGKNPPAGFQCPK